MKKEPIQMGGLNSIIEKISLALFGFTVIIWVVIVCLMGKLIHSLFDYSFLHHRQYFFKNYRMVKCEFWQIINGKPFCLFSIIPCFYRLI